MSAFLKLWKNHSALSKNTIFVQNSQLIPYNKSESTLITFTSPLTGIIKASHGMLLTCGGLALCLIPFTYIECDTHPIITDGYVQQSIKHINFRSGRLFKHPFAFKKRTNITESKLIKGTHMQASCKVGFIDKNIYNNEMANIGTNYVHNSVKVCGIKIASNGIGNILEGCMEVATSPIGMILAIGILIKS